MTRYKKGRKFEHKVRKLLEQHSFKVFRCAASKPLDLIAVKNGLVYFIECKSHIFFSGKEWWRLRELSRQLSHPIYIFFKVGSQIRIRVLYPHYWKLITVDEFLGNKHGTFENMAGEET